tara:strand:- start:1027 stop:2106 length:1080 start_codon:yes stop_codon:yes gene_type:complete
MKIYLVGGAIRDEYLGIPISERDWVVVNSSHEEMIREGFKQVGKNFPVYLHPITKEEYALARKEKKIGKGHKNFSFDTKVNISLKDDLKRRDLTINAIAKDEFGNIHDPYGGIKDLKSRRIQIVSNAFFEDPLRIFRVARFKTKLAKFNFSITNDSLKMLKKMSGNGEINFLSGERIWDETQKALSYENSSTYFATLKKVGALKYFEGLENVYSNNLRLLKKLDSKKNMIFEKWAVINLNSQQAEILEKKIRVPKKIANFRKTLSSFYKLIKTKNLDEKSLLSILNKMNYFRNELNLIESLNLLFKLKLISSKDNKNWNSLLKNLIKIKVNSKNLKPKEIKEKIYKKRIQLITNHKNDL